MGDRRRRGRSRGFGSVEANDSPVAVSALDRAVFDVDVEGRIYSYAESIGVGNWGFVRAEVLVLI